jgi:uncharacterized cysteine cluster protein YcgN (CxxCxxCC family)
MPTAKEPFWRTKPMAEMTRAEWESLCDGCGKCCLLKLQDEDSGELFHTDVACRLLDLHGCRCTRYKDRQELVPDCVKLSPENVGGLNFMPSTCAYRLVAEGKDLPDWHPLVTGRRDSVYKAGMSIRYRVISEDEIDEDDLPDRIVEWPR